MAQLGTRMLTITIDSVDYSAEVSSAKLTSTASSKDFISFADAAAGSTNDYALVLKIVQDPSTASLWDKIWTAAGTDAPVVLMPNGGTVDASHPKFTMTCTITEPTGDYLGGDAGTSTTARWVIDCTWPCTGKPVRSFA